MKRLLAISLAVVLALGLVTGDAMALTQPSVSLTNHEISHTADYSVTFTISEDVAEGENIIVEFSNDTDIGGITDTDTDSDVTVAATSGAGSTAFNATAAGSSSADTTLTITLPDVNAEDKIGAGATVQVVVSGVVNPSVPGCYTLLVSTSAETTPVESDVYAITAPLIPHRVSIPTEQNIISKADADYTIQFSLGAELGPTDDIVLTFPSDTVLSVPTATVAATIGWIGGHCDNARLDNVTWAFDTTARTVTATLGTGDAIGELAHVRIEITAGICNPSVPGDYTLTVHTSQETTPVESNAYIITTPPDPSLPGIVELYNAAGILIGSYTGDNAIQEAINDAWADSTIKVYTGTYTTNVDVNIDHLTIQSENGPYVTSVVAANSNDHVFDVVADYANISGFTVTGATSQAGIYLASGVSGCSIYDNDMTNNYRGIHLDHSNNNTLRNNSVTPSAWMGIELSSASSNTLTNNSVTSSSWHGIALYSSNNNTLTNNNASSNSDYGIFLNNSSDNTLTNNTTSNNDHGIQLYNSNNNTLTNNIVAVNSDYGIYLFDSSNNNTLINNTVVSNSGYGICFKFNSANNAIKNAILWDNSDDLDGGTATYSNIEDGDPGEGNISADPVFVDPAGDYHLKIGSPCIDKGTDVGAPTEDIEGNPRPIDGDGDGEAITDMGAFEYVPPVEPAIEATVDFDPDTLNLKSKGKVVTVYIELPEGYDVEGIDISTVMLNGIVPALAHPTDAGDYDSDGVLDLMVKFGRSNVQDMLEPGNEVEVTVSGQLTDSTSFEDADTIRVIDKY